MLGNAFIIHPSKKSQLVLIESVSSFCIISKIDFLVFDTTQLSVEDTVFAIREIITSNAALLFESF